ncbi:MAG: hypothetical protein HWE14_03460 [Flavobacteriia bacterium]|nr:hypothetical protein [Flavobacteriia bacterium]
MSKMLLLTGVVCLHFYATAQVCNFDSPDWTYQLTGNGLPLISSGTPYSPSGATFGVDNSNAMTASSGTVILTMDTVSTMDNPESLFTFKLGANAESGSGRGMDASSDYVVVRLSTSTSPFAEILRVKGYSNAQWDINSVHQNVMVDAQSSIVVSPFQGGEISYAAPGSFTVYNLPSDSSVVIQVELHSDRANEVWSLDNLKLIQPIYYHANSWSNLVGPSASDFVLLNDTLSLPNGPWISRGVVAKSSNVTSVQNVYLKTGDWLQISGDLDLDSNVTLTDSLGSGQVYMNNGTLSGSLSVERSALNSAGWRHLSVPVRTTYGDLSEDVNQVNFGASGSPSLFAWDAGNSTWYSFYDGTSVTKHQPVAIYGGPGWIDTVDRMRVKGAIAPIVDTVWLDYSVPNAASPFASSAGNEGWNFVGNPFPFPISLETLLTDSDFPSNLAPTVYIWSTEEQQYRSYNSSSGSVGGATPVIAPWQGFWMQFASNPGGLQPLYLKQSYCAIPQGDVLRKSLPTVHDFVVRSDSAQVKLVVADMPNGDLKWDYLRDHKQKNRGSLVASLLGVDGGIKLPLSLKTLDPNHIGGIPLEIEVDAISVIEISTDSKSQWWLEDLATGQWIDLAKQDHKALASPNLVNRFKLWRKKSLSRSLDFQADLCEVPKYEKGMFSNTSDLHWKLYDSSGAMLLDLRPGETREYSRCKGLHFWRSGECVEKVFYSRNP